jgi:plastocyanin
LAVATLLLVACGPNDGTPRSEQEAVQAKSVNVDIAMMKFQPDTVRVHKGDTIIWTNKDVVDHDATALPDSAWTSGLLHPGESYAWVADASSDYFCSIHVVMQGRVEVEE